MSRSKKKMPAGGNTTASSEKEDKKLWHKKFRRKNNELERKSYIESEITFFKKNELSNQWMSKDGKRIYFTELEIRNIVDEIIDDLKQNAHHHNLYLENFKNHFKKLIFTELCSFLKISGNKKIEISQKSASNFIEYFMNKGKRK